MTTVGLAFMSAGLLFLLVSAVGLVRLPDFFARVHAVSKSETMGIALLLVGLIFYQGLDLISLKFALIILFVAIANPVGAHLLTRAAVRTGVMPWRRGPQAPPPNKAD
ncbi:MAG: monovalent cation/H(+) antiporter subunit G [Chloroflexi bacterium]|nr:monovalent cation/H(+) antiporter subunit G [Chloroflexota bacterium]